MVVIKVKTYQELSKITANIIAAQIVLKPNSVLGLATGSTPIGTYQELINKNKNGEVNFLQVTTINLDEYVGLGGDNPQSYRYFMDNNLFNHINIDKKNTFVPNGVIEDLTKEVEDYDARIEKLGGIDLQLLGIGIDGHIGFNEPDDCFIKETHIVNLDNSTIEANSRFFISKEKVPKQAITLGMGGIMRAKQIVLIANGKNKKDILEKAIYGKITPKVPASILQLHNNVIVVYSEE